MRYREIQADLFDFGETHELVHCVSADFALGAGIAKSFARLGVAKELKSRYDGLADWPLYHGHAYQTGHIWNLVTKERYWHKPTYETLRTALVSLRDQLIALPVLEIAMPQIGCGLDRLQWDRVSEIIQDVFRDTDIDITVCIYPRRRNKETFRLLVVGSRSVNDYPFVKQKLDHFLSKIKDKYDIEIVSGGADGADSLAVKYAMEYDYPMTIMQADWDRYGNKAGYIRNAKMHQYIADTEHRGVVAFWDGKSRGTLHSKELANRYNNPIRWVLTKGDT